MLLKISYLKLVGYKKAQQEGRAFSLYIGKSEEEENLPSEYIYNLYDNLPIITYGPVST